MMTVEKAPGLGEKRVNGEVVQFSTVDTLYYVYAVPTQGRKLHRILRFSPHGSAAWKCGNMSHMFIAYEASEVPAGTVPREGVTHCARCFPEMFPTEPLPPRTATFQAPGALSPTDSVPSSDGPGTGDVAGSGSRSYGRGTCPVHVGVQEPCPTCESYIAAGL